MNTEVLTTEKCYHCGTESPGNSYVIDDKKFCCIGCKSVYQVLSSTEMCNYYSYNNHPGQAQSQSAKHLDYLDDPSIVSRLTDYADERVTTATFYVPAIHCSSCIWLLEHLYKFDRAIVHSRIDFLKKQVFITFKNQEISFKNLVLLMISIGYEPLISLQDVVKEKKDTVNRDLIKKIAVAGFCMGNVMLLSFPEYFGMSVYEDKFRTLFGWMNLAFSVPVTFYCGREFFTSAWAGLKHKLINLDAPLALIIAVLFLRSAFEIVTASGPGFTDTLTGLVFLLLMGRWVKQRTYSHISFKRDYRSYFPVAVTVVRDIGEKNVPLENLKTGDRILIRNNEIIPADSILMQGEALIDFSFVTGEAVPVGKVLGEILYAGGRQLGEAIELEVVKPVSQSYLTALWNNDTFTREGGRPESNFNDSIAKYFSIFTLIIAFSAGGYWMASSDTVRAWTAFTAVLIVACPCVLSLSTPFTLSAVLSLFDKHLFYLKSPHTVEQLAKIDTIVFDKTGTITSPDTAEVEFAGEISTKDKLLTASLARNSSHPISQKIIRYLGTSEYLPVSNFTEMPGTGIHGVIDGTEVRLGNAVLARNMPDTESSTAHLEIDGVYKGCFKIGQFWRPGLKSLFDELHEHHDLHLISGDNEADKDKLSRLLPAGSGIHFRQSPFSKLTYIDELQKQDRNVMMIGDGLNDAGALKKSDLGIAVTDNVNNFSPACDAILNGKSISKLPAFIRQSRYAMKTIRMSFVISASYNLVGIYFAVQGLLSPLLAAVLMPLSTSSVILFTSAATRIYAAKNKLS